MRQIVFLVELQFQLRIHEFAKHDASFFSELLSEARHGLALDGGEARGLAPIPFCKGIASRIVKMKLMNYDGPPPWTPSRETDHINRTTKPDLR